MGWYTTSLTDTFTYKYGDVVSAYRDASVGRLSVLPRVSAFDGNDAPLDLDDEFLGPLEVVIQERDLPWEPLGFDLGHDPHGESILVGSESGSVIGIVDTVSRHVGSLVDVLRAENPHLDEDPDGAIAELVLEFEFTWRVDRSAWPVLFAWLNGPFESRPITEATLGRGRLRDGWYVPPPSLEEIEQALAHATKPTVRHLVFHALAHALLDDEDRLELHQSGDDHTFAVPLSGELGGRSFPEPQTRPEPVVLFQLSEIPLLERIAEAFELPPSLRCCPFFIHGDEAEFDRPEEPPVSENVVARGMGFARFLLRRVLAATLTSRDAFAPYVDGGKLTVGWHGAASMAELTKAVSHAGCEAVPLSQWLEEESPSGELRSPFVPLEMWRKDTDDLSRATLSYVLDGVELGEAAPPDDFLMVWLSLTGGRLDLPADVDARLDAVIDRIIVRFSL